MAAKVEGGSPLRDSGWLSEATSSHRTSSVKAKDPLGRAGSRASIQAEVQEKSAEFLESVPKQVSDTCFQASKIGLMVQNTSNTIKQAQNRDLMKKGKILGRSLFKTDDFNKPNGPNDKLTQLSLEAAQGHVTQQTLRETLHSLSYYLEKKESAGKESDKQEPLTKLRHELIYELSENEIKDLLKGNSPLTEALIGEIFESAKNNEEWGLKNIKHLPEGDIQAILSGNSPEKEMMIREIIKAAKRGDNWGLEEIQHLSEGQVQEALEKDPELKQETRKALVKNLIAAPDTKENQAVTKQLLSMSKNETTTFDKSLQQMMIGHGKLEKSEAAQLAAILITAEATTIIEENEKDKGKGKQEEAEVEGNKYNPTGNLFRSNNAAAKTATTVWKEAVAAQKSKTFQQTIAQTMLGGGTEEKPTLRELDEVKIKEKITSENEEITKEELASQAGSQLKENQEWVKAATSQMFDATNDLIQSLPIEDRQAIAQVASAYYNEAKRVAETDPERFPNKKAVEDYANNAVVANFYLRIISPSIVTHQTPSTVMRRNLTLVSKLVQSTANQASDDNKTLMGFARGEGFIERGDIQERMRATAQLLRNL